MTRQPERRPTDAPKHFKELSHPHESPRYRADARCRRSLSCAVFRVARPGRRTSNDRAQDTRYRAGTRRLGTSHSARAGGHSR